MSIRVAGLSAVTNRQEREVEKAKVVIGSLNEKEEQVLGLERKMVELRIETEERVDAVTKR